MYKLVALFATIAFILSIQGENLKISRNKEIFQEA